MNLENGKIIFCEEPKKVGIVTNADENLVRLDGDIDTTPVDPEFCHLATTEELTGTEFEKEAEETLTEEPAAIVGTVGAAEEEEQPLEEAFTDDNIDMSAGEDIDH